MFRLTFYGLLLPLSLLIGAAAVVLWVRGYWARDVVSHTWTDPADKSAGTCQVATSRGRVRVERQREDWEDPANVVTLSAGSAWHYARAAPTPLDPPPDEEEDGTAAGRALGVSYARQRFTSPYRAEDSSGRAGARPRIAVRAWRETQVVFPLGYVAGLAAVPWVVLLWRRYRRQPSRQRLIPMAAAAVGTVGMVALGALT